MEKDYKLVQVYTGDEIMLNGLFSSGDINKPAVIFIHGFWGDFYSHKFYHSIASELEEKKIAIILAQTRGTGLYTEFLKKNSEDGVYLGSYHEKIEEAHLDISAWVEFLKNKGHKEIVLIGHSYGAHKVIRYIFEGNYKSDITKLVFLSPFDKNAFMERKMPGKWGSYVDKALESINSGRGSEIVPIPEYEDYPFTYNTYYSWYKKSDLNSVFDFYRKDYDFPVLKQINVPVLAIVGGKDEFIIYPEFDVFPEKMLKIIKEKVKKAKTLLLEEAGHCFLGFEKEVALEVGDFIENLN